MYNMQNRTDVLQFDVRWIGPHWRQYPVGEFFKLYEVACTPQDNAEWQDFVSGKVSSVIKVHPASLLLASAVRNEFGATRVNSWYRTPSHNSKVSGSKFSQHLSGMAIDIHCSRATPERVAEFAESLGAGGVGLYNSFTHLDCAGKSRRWDNRT